MAARLDLFTPSLDLGVLAGVTRDTLIELAPAQGYAVHEGRFPLAELRGAEEAFTSSSVRELMPIVEVDGNPIGRGRRRGSAPDGTPTSGR